MAGPEFEYIERLYLLLC